MSVEPRPEPAPVEELAALSAGLNAALARAARAGRRRLPAAEPMRELIPAPPPASASARPPIAPAASAASKPAPAGALAERVAAIRAAAQGAPDLESLRRAVVGCTACELCTTRTQTVFSDGSARARVMFVGEAPGADEDEQGVPFVGAAGRLLTDIITKGMGLAREDVYIANVLKCRPPGNRDPAADEKALCTGWLERQIELVDPDVIVPLGRHASGHLLASDAPMGRMRGRVHQLGRRKLVPTYHPAFLLRSPHMKKDCWADIQLAMKELGLERERPAAPPAS